MFALTLVHLILVHLSRNVAMHSGALLADLCVVRLRCLWVEVAANQLTLQH